jgi:hypothetical protein
MGLGRFAEIGEQLQDVEGVGLCIDTGTWGSGTRALDLPCCIPAFTLASSRRMTRGCLIWWAKFRTRRDCNRAPCLVSPHQRHR